MAKKNSRLSKKLEALDRSERINQLWKETTTESEALQNSAGESRPEYESHVLDLLEQRKPIQPKDLGRSSGGVKRSKKGRK